MMYKILLKLCTTLLYNHTLWTNLLYVAKETHETHIKEMEENAAAANITTGYAIGPAASEPAAAATIQIRWVVTCHRTGCNVIGLLGMKYVLYSLTQ
jgi:hypothetical protein